MCDILLSLIVTPYLKDANVKQKQIGTWDLAISGSDLHILDMLLDGFATSAWNNLMGDDNLIGKKIRIFQIINDLQSSFLT